MEEKIEFETLATSKPSNIFVDVLIVTIFKNCVLAYLYSYNRKRSSFLVRLEGRFVSPNIHVIMKNTTPKRQSFAFNSGTTLKRSSTRPKSAT